MATFTTDANWDDAARTAGEQCNVNGATVTFRTDTRYHGGFTAGTMLGTVNGISVSAALGGIVVIDATKVRWMPYNSGTGTVPAIGTTISQGSVTGYLLGVFADAASAPVTAGGAVPATGFIKFREVNNGPFAAGALTGISASATSADVVGWIEIVLNANASISPGSGFGTLRTRGAWFELGTTNGTRGQTFQVPTNGGGAGTHAWAFQVETAAGSGVYEWWATMQTAGSWNTTNLSADARSKYLAESVGGGVIRIGSDGTNNLGYLPPTGCKVRIMNIFGRTSSTAVNGAPGGVTRGNIIGSGGGNLDFQYLHADWNPSGLSNVSQLNWQNVAFEFAVTISGLQKASSIDNCVIGGYTQPGAAPFAVSNVTAGMTLSNMLVVTGTTPTNGLFSITNGKNYTLSNINAMYTKVRTTTAGYAFQLSNVNNVTCTNLKLRGYGMNIATCNSTDITGIDYIDKIGGETTTTQPVTAMTRITVSSNVKVQDITFGDAGTLPNSHPMGPIFMTLLNTGTIKIRNAGTRTNRINAGGATTGAQYVWTSSGYENDIRLQRLYFDNTRVAVFNAPTNARNSLFEHVYGLMSQSTTINSIGTKFRGNGLTPNFTGTVSNGLMWMDNFTSDTTGQISWFASTPLPEQSSLWSLTAALPKGSGFTDTGQLQLDVAGDEFIVEMPEFVKGHTGFSASTAPTGGGYSSGTFADYYYQIDKGSGWNGTWKAATIANMSAETGISPSTGFKLKLRAVANATVVNSAYLNYFRFYTTTTLADQAANLYPLDTVTLEFTGLKVGSEVRAYTGTDPATATLIGGTETTAGSTFSFTHSNAGQSGYIHIFAMGYQPIYLPYTYDDEDQSLLIQQVIDRNYVNP